MVGCSTDKTFLEVDLGRMWEALGIGKLLDAARLCMEV